MLNAKRVCKQLEQFDFETLFIEELGWDHHSETDELQIDDARFSLSAVAEKRGMVVLLCHPEQNQPLPVYATRRKIERKVAKTRHEHLIIYIDNNQSTQVWQWVRREPGKPDACREHTYHKEQSGTSLIQKLERLAVSFDEEETITLVDVAGRAGAAFNVEKITKKFYDKFKKEHTAFLKFIEGIAAQGNREWYASIMLNRLMFVYFIQKKGFLDGDPNYLRNRLRLLQESAGEGSFHSFYRHFLLRLFHEGLGKKTTDRDSDLDALLGTVPYLNGGLFDVHELEKEYDNIQITDEAFEKLFDFFEQYQWHLDERPLRQDNEINPDVLGYIFEKYINQKQMGAYYTKEDITEYISKNTIIPYIFDAARKKCKIAFEGEQSVWKLLQKDPDRYIYDAVGKGCDLPLPDEIEAGVTEIAKRTKWNTPASEEYALPTEIWRELVARRTRYKEIYTKLKNGELQSINDLITYNLNIRQFAQDVIESCEGPELLRAIWQAIVGRIPSKSNETLQHGITILDPTCGSGAFLFAALNVLEPLYEACLDRMQVFVNELNLSTSTPSSEKYSDFKKELSRVASHPNQKYFVMKSIILNNLYGVDIMAEAVEICKLRLFLKLVAQVERARNIEPLPDIDFNIRCGNTLVGFVSRDEVKDAIMLTGGKQRSLITEYQPEYQQIIDTINQKAQELQQTFNLFRRHQVEGDGSVPYKDKRELQKRLTVLEEDLNQGLAMKYGINAVSEKETYEKWLESHQPFHWFIEYYGIMTDGGFDVIIGNPPYVEYKKVNKLYTIQRYYSESCGNLYAFTLERSSLLIQKDGMMGLIIPISLTAAQRMKPLQEKLFNSNSSIYLSNFALRPAALFPGVMQRLTILIAALNRGKSLYTTDYITWYANEREHLFDSICFEFVGDIKMSYSIPKVNNNVSVLAIKKILSKCKSWETHKQFVGEFSIYYHNAGGYWIKTFDFRPYYKSSVDPNKKHTTISRLSMPSYDLSIIYLALLNSSLFYFFWKSVTDARHVYPSDIALIPIDLPVEGSLVDDLKKLIDILMNELSVNCERIVYGKATVDQYSVAPCKPIIDKIDYILAKHYGFTDDEFDFIINYDIKYRMGIK